MIIYNTTYNVSNDKAIPFIKWLRTRYIPFATESKELKEARLAHLMVENDGNSNSFSLQFIAVRLLRTSLSTADLTLGGGVNAFS